MHTHALDPLSRTHSLAPATRSHSLATRPDPLLSDALRPSQALGIITKKTTIPTRFSAAAVGKRKAPAGAVVRKRSGALVVDA